MAKPVYVAPTEDLSAAIFARQTQDWNFPDRSGAEGNGKRLAIECDEDRYHPLEKLPEDMDRQSVLERMGWVFTHIRSWDFLRNPARSIEPVFEKLELREIPPVGNSTKTARAGLS